MPRSRGRALIGLCAALAYGDARPRPRAPTATTYARGCSTLPGIGPWTADYIALRALGHPDVFLPTDIGIRDALAALGPRPGAGRRAGRGLATLALLRPAAPLADPDPRHPHHDEEN